MGTTESLLVETSEEHIDQERRDNEGTRTRQGSAPTCTSSTATRPHASHAAAGLPATVSLSTKLPILWLNGIVDGLPRTGKYSLLQRLAGKDPFNERSTTDRVSCIQTPYKAAPDVELWDRLVCQVSMNVSAPTKVSHFFLYIIDPRHDRERIQKHMGRTLQQWLVSTTCSGQEGDAANDFNRPVCLCVILNFRDTWECVAEDALFTSVHVQAVVLDCLQQLEDCKGQVPIEPSRVHLACLDVSLVDCYGLVSLHTYLYRQVYLPYKRWEWESNLARLRRVQQIPQPPLQSYREYRKQQRKGPQKEQSMSSRQMQSSVTTSAADLSPRERRQDKDRKKHRRTPVISQDWRKEASSDQSSSVQLPTPARRSLGLSQATKTREDKSIISSANTLEEFFASDNSDEDTTKKTRPKRTGLQYQPSGDESDQGGSDDEFYYDESGQLHGDDSDSSSTSSSSSSVACSPVKPKQNGRNRREEVQSRKHIDQNPPNVAHTKKETNTVDHDVPSSSSADASFTDKARTKPAAPTHVDEKSATNVVAIKKETNMTNRESDSTSSVLSADGREKKHAGVTTEKQEVERINDESVHSSVGSSNRMSDQGEETPDKTHQQQTDSASEGSDGTEVVERPVNTTEEALLSKEHSAGGKGSVSGSSSIVDGEVANPVAVDATDTVTKNDGNEEEMETPAPETVKPSLKGTNPSADEHETNSIDKADKDSYKGPVKNLPVVSSMEGEDSESEFFIGEDDEQNTEARSNDKEEKEEVASLDKGVESDGDCEVSRATVNLAHAAKPTALTAGPSSAHTTKTSTPTSLATTESSPTPSKLSVAARAAIQAAQVHAQDMLEQHSRPKKHKKKSKKHKKDKKEKHRVQVED